MVYNMYHISECYKGTIMYNFCYHSGTDWLDIKMPGGCVHSRHAAVMQ